MEVQRYFFVVAYFEMRKVSASLAKEVDLPTYQNTCFSAYIAQNGELNPQDFILKMRSHLGKQEPNAVRNISIRLNEITQKSFENAMLCDGTIVFQAEPHPLLKLFKK